MRRKISMLVSATVLALLLSAGVMHAELCVNFTGQYVTAHTLLNGRVNGGSWIPFSDTVLRNPNVTNASGGLLYGHLGGTSIYFYGGCKTNQIGCGNDHVYNSTADSDKIRCSPNATGLTAPTNITTVWLWKYTDNLNGMINASQINVTQMDVVVQATGYRSNRFVICQSGNYYISEVTHGLANANGSKRISDPSGIHNAIQWYNYNPASDMQAVGSSVTLLNSLNIEFAGAWVFAEPTNRVNASQLAASILSFQSWGYVPEPTGIVALGLLAACAARRYHQHS